MLERFLKQTEFTSQDDFVENFKVSIPEQFNFGYDIVDEWAAKSPEKVALCWTNDKGEHRDFTFAEIKEKSDQTAYYFQSLGIVKGDMVMLILKRRFEYWFAIVALHKLGAIAIPATHLLTEKDLIYRNNAAEVKMIVTVGEVDVVKHIELSKAESPSLKNVVSIGPIIPEGWGDFHKEISAAPAFNKPTYQINNDDISLLYFTSGTTGNPKMVTHDFTYPLAHIITAKYWHNLHENSLHLTLADTGWAKAAWGKLYGQWIVGANIFVYDFEKFMPEDILHKIEKYGVTSFCAPPTVFRFMIKEDLTRFDLSSLEYCTIAGEALNPKVYDEFYRLTGIQLKEGFGQTETTVLIGTYPWVTPKPGSMGIVNPQFDVLLVNANNEVTAPGEQGQIVLRLNDDKTLGLFKEYHQDTHLTNTVMQNGYYYTGDIAWRDEDGYFWFIGRADDVIKSSGYRIGPFEVESALMTHPAVVECAITGVPDETRGQVVKATIVLAKEYKSKADHHLEREIQEHVKKVTAPYKYPRIIEFVDELPKTISGKIRRVEIRERSE